jgi:hypothetical protein
LGIGFQAGFSCEDGVGRHKYDILPSILLGITKEPMA